MATAVHLDSQQSLQLSPTGENSITVLEGGHGEVKKIYPQHHDHNNNGNIYQNLAPIHSNHVKSESHSPVDGTNKIIEPSDFKGSSSESHLASSSDLDAHISSSERPRCWTKI